MVTIYKCVNCGREQRVVGDQVDIKVCRASFDKHTEKELKEKTKRGR